MNTWIKKDLKYIWHPYTQMSDCPNLPPILIEKAQGMRLYDNKGNFYYDTISSWWCNVHGHNHPLIKNAIKTQIDSLEHTLFAGFTNKPAILLAEKLISITSKNLKKVFFSDNGSTAVETSLKMSFQYWQNIGKKTKTKFISLDYGYHGDTIGAMSVSGLSLFNEVFKPLCFSSYKAPSPYCYRCPFDKNPSLCNIDCIKDMDVLLENHHNEIAGLIIEPLIMCAGGMLVYPKEYLIKAGNLTKKYNIHLILDEVATGFGRTGKMFACEWTDIEPDFLCLSKGITSGYLPLGVTLTTDDIYNGFYADFKEKKTFYHGHTYTGNPISCAVALKSLEIFEEENILERLKDIIPILQQGIKEMRGLKFVGDTRGIGMIGAIELVKDKNKKTPFSFEERIGLKVYKKGLGKNLILRPLGNVIYLFLPLCPNKRELKDVLDRVYATISL